MTTITIMGIHQYSLNQAMTVFSVSNVNIFNKSFNVASLSTPIHLKYTSKYLSCGTLLTQEDQHHYSNLGNYCKTYHFPYTDHLLPRTHQTIVVYQISGCFYCILTFNVKVDIQVPLTEQHT